MISAVRAEEDKNSVSQYAPSLLTNKNALNLNKKDQSMFQLSFTKTSKDYGLCHKNEEDVFAATAKQFKELQEKVDKISKQASCIALDQSANRYSQLNCDSLVQCAESKSAIKLNGQFQISFARNVQAEDYASYQLNKNLEPMLKMEKLRQYTKTKFGAQAIPQNCHSNFDISLNNKEQMQSCSPAILNEGLKVFTSHCTNDKNSCSPIQKRIKDDYSNFISNSNRTNDEKSNIANKLMNEFVEADLKKENGLEDQITSEIFTILSAKKSNEEITKEIFKILNNDKDKLDPILSFDPNLLKNDKKSELKEFINDQLVSKKIKPLEFALTRFTTALNKFKEKQARKNLTNSCNLTRSLSGICREANEILKQKKLPIDRKAMAEWISSTELDDRFDSYQYLLNKESFNSKDDFHILMEAERCLAFGFVTPPKIVLQDPTLTSEDGTNYINNSTNSAGPDSNKNILPADNSINSVATSDGDNNLSPGIGATTVYNAETEPEVEASAKGTVVDQINEALKSGQSSLDLPNTDLNPNKNLFGTNALLPNGTDGLANNGSDQNENSPNGEKNKKASTNGMANDQVAELSKRLAAAEENLAKLKADKEAADQAAKEKENKLKIDEQNKTIADLHNQLDAIKKGKVSSTSATPGSEGSRGAEAVNSNTATNSASRAPAAVVDDDLNNNRQNNYYQSNNAISADNSRTIVDNNSTGGSQTSGKGGNSSRSSSSGIVLTKVDGLSSEKVTETIVEKISELNGQPFLIEEGGMIKEIIPVVKDGKVVLDENGKPLFEKIVKGKVGDKKFATNENDKKGRAPASITTPADLSKDQEEELKRERARYLKLKELTNGVSSQH